MTSFEEGVERFRRLVEEQGYPSQLVWVREEDVLLASSRRAFVRVPMPTENEGLARSRYEEGLLSQRGVLFSALCSTEDITYCYSWVPKNDDEAQQRLMPRDIKVSVPMKEFQFEAKLVRVGILWWWLKWRHKKHHQRAKWFFE